MDISIDRMGVEALNLPEDLMNRPTASVSPHEEENHGKTSEFETGGSVSNQQARELTEEVQGYIDRMNISIAFSTYGEKNKKVSIIVSDKETGKLIREIPPEELQRLHVKMEELAGIIFDEMV